MCYGGVTGDDEVEGHHECRCVLESVFPIHFISEVHETRQIFSEQGATFALQRDQNVGG